MRGQHLLVTKLVVSLIIRLFSTAVLRLLLVGEKKGRERERAVLTFVWKRERRGSENGGLCVWLVQQWRESEWA